MSKISIDLGGSAIRMLFLNKDDKKTLMRLPSRHLRISATDRVVKDIKDKLDDFQIVESSLKEVVGRYVRGEACSYFDGVQSVVDNQELKVNQVATYVNAIHTLAKYVLAMHGASGETIELKKIGLVIPVREYYSDAVEVPKEKLAGTHTVYFPIPKKTVTFSIHKSGIKIGGEGAVVAFNMRRDPRYKKLITEGVGIVPDVGFRSTDVILFNKFIAQGKSARSFPHGGITLEARLSAELEKLGHPVSNDGIQEVIKEGSLGMKNMGSVVHRSKEVLGGILRQDITTVLAHSELSIKSVDYVIPVGRPYTEQKDPKIVKSERYTGSLVGELIKGMRPDVTVINCGDLETANVNALFEMLG